MEDESQVRANGAEPPLGMYTSRVDEKGRLKLPKDHEEFFRSFGDQRFFVTRLDDDIARIYPMEVWRHNLKLLEEDEQNPEYADAVSLIADHWGAIANVDSQGRILIPPDLRRDLELENSPVRVRHYKGYLSVIPEKDYKSRTEQADGMLKDAMAALRRKGFK